MMSGSTVRFNSASSINIQSGIASDEWVGGGRGGGIYKVGTGDLTLSGINTYTGGTHLQGGRLIVSEDLNLGSKKVKPGEGGALPGLIFDGGTLTVKQTFRSPSLRPVELSGRGVFEVEDGKELTMKGAFTGSGTLAKKGSGTFILQRDDYSGPIEVEEGPFELRVTNVSSAITNSGTLIFNKDVDSVMTGHISGAGNLEKQGAGTLTLSGNNNYTGHTLLKEGTLKVSQNSALGDPSSQLKFKSNGSTLFLDGNFGQTARAFGMEANGSVEVPDKKTVTLSGRIESTGVFKKKGLGTLILSGTTSPDRGGIDISEGILQVGKSENLGSSRFITISGSTLRVAGGFKRSDFFFLKKRAIIEVAEGQLFEINGYIQDQGALEKKGPGTLALMNNGANRYSGGTIISEGTLRVSKDNNLGEPSRRVKKDVALRGGTLSLENGFSSNRVIDLDTPSAVEVPRNATATLRGTLKGGGTLKKKGKGSLILSGDNTSHTGNMDLIEGTLRVSKNEALGSLDSHLNFNGGTLFVSEDLTIPREMRFEGPLPGTVEIPENLIITLSGTLGSEGDRGALFKTGKGTLKLRGRTNKYRGTHLIEGTLETSYDGSLGDPSGVLSLGSDTTLKLGIGFGGREGSARAVIFKGPIVIDVSSNPTILSGSFVGEGGFTKEGIGRLVLSSSENNIQGMTKIEHGELEISAQGLKGNVDIESTGKLIFNEQQATKATYAGVISGSGDLIKKGPGTLVLSGKNRWKGHLLQLSQGTLQVSKDENLGIEGEFAIFQFDGGTLLVTESFDLKRESTIVPTKKGKVSVEKGKTFEMSGEISGIGSLKKMGAGTLILSGGMVPGERRYSGGTIVSEGTLKVSKDKNLGSGDLTLEGGTLFLGNGFSSGKAISVNNNDPKSSTPSTVEVPYSAEATLSGVLSGEADLNKRGEGTLILSGNNSAHEGDTNLFEGILKISNGNSLGSSNAHLNFKGGALFLSEGFTTSARKMRLEKSATIEVEEKVEATLSGELGEREDPGALIKKGSGKLLLTGIDNKYKGGTRLMGGTLSPSVDRSLGALSGDLVFVEKSTLELGSSFKASARDAILEGEGIIDTKEDVTLSGTFRGKGRFTKKGAATLFLSSENGDSNIEGVTTVEEGKLKLNAHTISANIVISASAKLIFNQPTEETKAIYAGVISGKGTLVKEGPAPLSLSETNFYTGETTILDGTLRLKDYGTLGNADLEIERQGTLLISTRSRTIPVKALSGKGTIHIHDSNTLQVESGSFSGAISPPPTSFDLLESFGQEAGGGLTKISGGELTLSGEKKTYTGKTTIKKGTLKLATRLNPASDLEVLKEGVCELQLGELQVRKISGEGTIKLGNHRLKVDGGSFAGNIEGSAGSRLEQMGQEGILILSGINTFKHLSFEGVVECASDQSLGDPSQALELNGGTFSPTQTMRLDRNVHVSANSLIDVGHSFSDRFRLTLLGSLTGNQGIDLKKEGFGKMEIGHATNSFEGNLLLERGTLVIPKGKKLKSAVVRITGGDSILIGASEPQATEESLGKLEHTYGTVRIGQEGSSQVGTFKVGTYTMGASATLHIRLKPTFGSGKPLETEADLLQAETANFLDDNGGSLFLDLSAGFYEPGAIYTILKARILTADHLEKIKVLEKHPLHFKLIREYLPSGQQALQIEVLHSEAVLPVELDQLKGDAREIAENLFSAPSHPSEELKRILKPIIESTPEEFIEDLLLLGPQKFGRGITLLNAQSNISVAREMNRAQALDGGGDSPSLPASKTDQSVWVTPIGFTTTQRKIESLYSFKSEGYGFVAGYSRFSRSLVFSIGSGYTDSRLKWNDNLGKARVQAAYVTPSFGYQGRKGNFGVVLSCASRFYDVERKMRFQGRDSEVKKRAHNEHKGYDILLRVAGSLRIKCPDSFQRGLFIIPSVCFDYVNLFESGYQEIGARPINLFVKRIYSSLFHSEFSLKISKQIDRDGMRICPTLFIARIVDLPLTRGKYVAGFQEELSKRYFTLQGYDQLTDQINLGAELLIMRPGKGSLKMAYRASLGDSFWRQEGLLNLNFEF